MRAGDGGDGAVSFRREAHVPKGGPDGGDGGRGGDVVLVAEEGRTSLVDLHRNPHRRAEDGGAGAGRNRTGADGSDEVVAAPVGTVVRDADSGRILADLTEPGEQAVVAEGGRGGRGNARFANRYRRLPSFAEYGEEVEQRSLHLELKMIADAGLVGWPSAGKSSLISRLSAATPRVESWPFTTLTPHLGVMRAGTDEGGTPVDVVLADVPGLIEGASDGRGLGHQFLRHVERCLVLVHILDGFPFDPERDPVSDLELVQEELRRHDPDLAQRPRLLVVNKIDLPDARAMAEMVTPVLEERGEEVLWVSALTGEGLPALRRRLGELVAAERERIGGIRRMDGEDEEELVIRLEPEQPAVRLARDSEGRFHVLGDRLERWIQMTPLGNPEAVRYLQGRMRRAGVEQALVRAGARSGDDVVIGGVEFEFEPELADLPEEERVQVLAGELDEEGELGEIELPPGAGREAG